MIPTFSRFTISDIPKAPDWIGYVFQKLNLFCEQTVATLTRNLSIGENVQGQKFTFTVSTPSDYATGGFNRVTLQYTGGGQPTCAVVGRIVDSTGDVILTSPVVTNWQLNLNVNPSTVVIDYISGLAADRRYTINLLVL
jgi:hypothetical protein